MEWILDQAGVEAWGRAIGRRGAPGTDPLWILLHGELGAGKSVFARAVARGAGIEGPIPSPTYTLVLRHGVPSGRDAGGRGQDRATVLHMDLYRLEDPEDLVELGWDEFGLPGEILLVEWPLRADPDRLPSDRWELRLDRVAAQPALRHLTLARVGNPPPIPLPEEPGAVPSRPEALG